MSDISIRRADFMMVLAYATDLATGQSRDFADPLPSFGVTPLRLRERIIRCATEEGMRNS